MTRAESKETSRRKEAQMIKDYSGTLYGNYRQVKFTDVYEDVNTFLEDYKNNGFPTIISESNASIVYYLLYSKHGNDILAPSDTNRFKYRLFSIIWQFGPTWEKELEIQNKIRNLTEEELLTGGKKIYNTAAHPEVEPSTNTSEELAYINNQNVAKDKKSKLEAYGLLTAMLKEDVTESFIRRFDSLFLNIVEPEAPLYYVTEDDEE